MNRRSILLGGAALALAPGLAVAAPPREPGPDEGLVYFYHARHTQRSKARVSTYIKIDRKLVADLEVGEYTWIYLKAGEYALGVRSGAGLTGIGRTSFPLAVGAGKTHYIRYARENVGSMVIPDLTEPPAEEGREAVARSRYVKPKKEWTV